MKSVFVSLLASGAYAFPWVADVPGVESPWSRFANNRRLEARQQSSGGSCPFNANHKPANPITSQYPYNSAKNGISGKGKGGFQVPAKGDTAHQFVAPGPNDIRGPCPGLNAAANHNFLAHDGITTFNELVDAQQNVYNVGYDLATLLAALGLTLTDGDIVTEKLSIGCDATHNKFEADSSLTRNDYFTHNGDDYSFNGTLFGMMDKTCGSNFDIKGLSLYRKQRYDQSQAENPNFYFGPLSVLLYRAASFLYELMPSGTNGYKPDLATISTFFGAKKNDDGTWGYTAEKIPDDWTNRVSPYTNNDVTTQILEMYLLNPVLFGGNTADGKFDTIDFGAIKDGKISAGISATDTSCLLYQLATQSVPSSLNGLITPTVKALAFIATKLSPSFKNLGCPLPLT